MTGGILLNEVSKEPRLSKASTFGYPVAMMRHLFACVIVVFTTVRVEAAHQDWSVSHQPDRFMDRVMMEAWADADNGPGRLELYCDTENGFRMIFLPHRAFVAEGPSRVTLLIDNQKPIVFDAYAFGDDDTDVITVHDSAKVEPLLSGAHHIIAQFVDGDGKSAEDAFTLGSLTAQNATLLRVCPVR